MIGQTISHYKILEKLGEGGMGVVYKAQDTSLDRAVALKFLPHYLTSDAAEKERFYHEARAASGLNHPNITTIHEIKEFNDQLYLSMELVEGKTLKQLLEGEPLPVKRVLDIAIQVCDGLTAAHEKGVVHRDIKSDNIMVTAKGQVKIMDFGLAKVKGATKLTKAGSTIGTAAYMSPEQAQGLEVDHRSDIFSFGVVLYELLTSKLPFRGEHQAAVMYSLMNEDPQPIARFNDKVSAELERIVSKAMAKDPEDRYQHIDEMLADLRRERKQLEYARAGYATTSTISQQMPAAPPKKRSFLKYGIPGAVVSVGVVVLLVFNPFNFQITTQRSTAGPAKKSLAVLYFENIPDPEDKDHTGEMLTNLLTTSLFQTNDIEVISRERLYDIQKELGQGDQKSISPSMGTRIAQRAGVSMMLLGSILQRQPSLAVTYRLIDVQSGKILSTQRLSGFTPEKVFSLVDTLALMVKSDLQVSPHALAESTPVSQVTTSSPEAYRSYLEGVELNNRFYTAEAKAAFRRALELDSNFAMAYFRLATLSTGGAPGGLTIEEINRAMRKANELSQNLPERERLIIQSTYAGIIENDLAKAIDKLEMLVEKYPREETAYNGLGVLYGLTGQREKAVKTYLRGLQIDSLNKGLWNALAYGYALNGKKDDALAAIEHYIGLAPAEPNPYDSKGDILAMFGDKAGAVTWWEKAIAFRAGFPSLAKLSLAALTRQEYDLADQYARRYAGTLGEEEKYYGDMMATFAVLKKGQMNAARIRYRDMLPLHRKLHLTAIIGYDLGGLILIDYELHDYAAMVEDAKQYSDLLTISPLPDQISGRMTLAIAYLKNGNGDASTRLAREVENDLQHASPGAHAFYDWGMGILAFESGRYDQALQRFDSASKMFPTNHLPIYHHALCLLKAGHRDEAVSEFQRMVESTPILNGAYELDALPMAEYRPAASIKAHYWLGVAYEEQGQKDLAVKEFKEFLRIWKDADFKSQELLDAKARLGRLATAQAG